MMTDTQTTSVEDTWPIRTNCAPTLPFLLLPSNFLSADYSARHARPAIAAKPKAPYAFRYPPSGSPAFRTGDLLRYKSVWRVRTPDPARLRSSDAPLHSARVGSREMSSRRKFLQDPPDPAIIAFAEELGRMLARREFARLEQTAERLQRDEEGDHGQSCDLRPILIRPAEPSLD